MKYLRFYFAVIIILHFNIALAQDFGGDKIGIANFARRMYNVQPFNGVKLLQTQDGQDYMISVVELKKDLSKSGSIISRTYINNYHLQKPLRNAN
jgi:hypothetical protein